MGPGSEAQWISGARSGHFESVDRDGFGFFPRAGFAEAPVGRAPPPRHPTASPPVPDAGPSFGHLFTSEAPNRELSDVSFFLCPDIGPRMSLPSFADISQDTRDCFTAYYGLPAFPDTACCPPLAGPGVCGLTSLFGWAVALREYDPTDWTFPEPPSSTADQADIDAIVPLYQSAVQLLRDNLDIVQWVTCLVQSWSPQMAGVELSALVTGLVTGEIDSYLTVIGGFAPNSDGGGTAQGAAFTWEKPRSDGTVGVIVPADGEFWTEWRTAFASPDSDLQFAAVAVAAEEILHEMVHIAVDGVGGNHTWRCFVDAPPPACWDEPRMIETAWRWAMAQRFPCLTSFPFGLYTDGFGDSEQFAWGGCIEPWNAGQ